MSATPYFLRNEFVFASFVKDHLVTISDKMFSILTIGFKGYERETGDTPGSHFLKGQICFSYFYSSPSVHLCQTILNSDQQF